MTREQLVLELSKFMTANGADETGNLISDAIDLTTDKLDDQDFRHRYLGSYLSSIINPPIK
jgi:hypothetical protein